MKIWTRTFLASPPGVSLQTRADVVPRTHAAVLTGRTAHRCWKRRTTFTLWPPNISHLTRTAHVQRRLSPPTRVTCLASGFTVLTLCAIETVRTPADVRANTPSSVETHGRARSWRGRIALACRGGNARTLRHTAALTRLTGQPAPARWTRAHVWRKAPASVVTMKTANYCGQSQN